MTWIKNRQKKKNVNVVHLHAMSIHHLPPSDIKKVTSMYSWKTLNKWTQVTLSEVQFDLYVVTNKEK